MTLKSEQFERKPLYVEAVQVTVDNMEEVALWCHGTIETEQLSPDQIRSYISVKVENPMSERLTKAIPGDWVLFAHNGFKVYQNKAFRKGFVKSKDRGAQAQDKPMRVVTSDEQSKKPVVNVYNGPPTPRDPATPTPMNIPKQRTETEES